MLRAPSHLCLLSHLRLGLGRIRENIYQAIHSHLSLSPSLSYPVIHTYTLHTFGLFKAKGHTVKLRLIVPWSISDAVTFSNVWQLSNLDRKPELFSDSPSISHPPHRHTQDKEKHQEVGIKPMVVNRSLGKI